MMLLHDILCPRCIGLALGFLLVIGSPGSAQAQETLRQGAIMFEDPDSQQMLYYLEIVEDTTDSSITVYVREGLEESGPAVTLPELVFRQLHGQLEMAAPVDSVQMERVAFSYDSGLFSLSLAQKVNIIPVLLLCGAFVTLIGVLFFWFRKRLSHEKKRQTELVISRKGLSERREEERLRLARDLHDGPVQDLHAVRMQLNMLASPGKHPKLNGRDLSVDRVQGELLHVINELRSISEDLRPPALGPFGLAAALEAYVERFRRLHPDVEVTLDLADDGQQLPERVRLALFRICQEALNNAAQHAEPQTIAVRFELTEEQVTLEVCDDGQGFELPHDWVTLTRDGHYGLQGMAERAEALGARLDIRSALGSGTCAHLSASLAGHNWETMKWVDAPV